MSRGTWNSIKESKWFYVRTYRRIGVWVLMMLLLNGVLLAFLAYSYLNRGIPDFYATNGYLVPIKLTPLTAPNYSTEALLPPDPADDMGQKAIPD